MPHSIQAQSTTIPYRVTLTDPSGHTWYADEPADKGGQDTAPNPILLLLSALGACTTITLEMYANHKGIKLDHVQVDLALNPSAEPEAGQNNIERKIILKGVTKPVVLDAVLNKQGEHPMLKVPAIGFNATTSFNRSDFGIGSYVPMVGDKITVNITTEAAAAK
jgi:putative redox protein